MANSESTSTRGSLLASIRNRMPYTLQTIQPREDTNTKYRYFKHAGQKRPELLAKNSVSSSNQFNTADVSAFERDRSFADIMYANLPADKGGRIQDYRTMASYSEVADALDEFCDEVINVDDENRIAKLNITDPDLSSEQKEELSREFQRFVDYFDLQNKGWEYFRQLVVEGEVFFELVIHEAKPDAGVLGVIVIPSELIDPVYHNIQNMLIKGFIYRKPIFDPNDPNKVERYEFIPMDQNQVVYVNSGAYNETKTVVIPFLENARRPYRQLTLIEDAIVIYRLVRAPERLVFNVDVGNLPAPKAEGYLRKLIQNYWSSKTFDIDKNDIAQKFNPQSMLDAFWFAKRTGSEGTSVTQLPGGQNLGQLDDLMFFVKKLYRALKVPSSRLDPQDAVKDGTEILREELKFARFVIRQQQRFAAGIRKGFITHLKLMGVWDEFELSEMDVNIEFNVPTNFYEMRESQRLELRANNYNLLAGNEMVSNTFAQKKYLQWSDSDILANRKFLKVDAAFKWELAQIEAGGPNWQSAAMQAAAGEEGAPAAGGLGMGGGGFGAGVPEFGGGPAALEPEADASTGSEPAESTPAGNTTPQPTQQ